MTGWFLQESLKTEQHSPWMLGFDIELSIILRSLIHILFEGKVYTVTV